MRKILAAYYKDIYILEPMANESILIDESLFAHKDNQQIWLLVLINNRTRVIRFKIVKERTSAIMKKIINTLVPKGNIIITDGALYYFWLCNADSGYIHHVHNHGHGDFGQALDSTSHVEQL